MIALKLRRAKIWVFLMSYMYKTYTTQIYNVSRPMKSLMKNINANVW